MPNYTLMRSALINGVNSAEENKEGVGTVVCLMQAMIVILQRPTIMTITVERNQVWPGKAVSLQVKFSLKVQTKENGRTLERYRQKIMS